MANRTKLTEEVQQRICQAIQLGATYDLACLYGGVDDSTFRRWRHANSAFRAAVEKAEGQAVVGWLAAIEKAARDGEWTAAAWKLERRYPAVYGRRQLEVTGRDGGPIPLAVVPFDYRAAVDGLGGDDALGPEPGAPALAPGPNGHRPPPGALTGRRDGPPLGEDADGG